jgi:hypothetical protein
MAILYSSPYISIYAHYKTYSVYTLKQRSLFICFCLLRVELVLQLGQTRFRRRSKDPVSQILFAKQSVERHHSHPIRQDARRCQHVGRTHVFTGIHNLHIY